MKPLEDILSRIVQARETYDTCKLSLRAEQSEILRELSVSFADLTDHRISAREDWMFHYNQIDGSNPVREKYADHKVPELYKIRRVMDATKILIDSVRSTLSKAVD